MTKHSESQQRAFANAAAHYNRQTMTPAERRLWIDLEPLGFKAQVPILTPREKSLSKQSCIMDFYHEASKLCVEVDGKYHERRKWKDARRDRQMQSLGIRTLRFRNNEIFSAELRAMAVRIIRGELNGKND